MYTKDEVDARLAEELTRKRRASSDVSGGNGTAEMQVVYIEDS